MHLRNPKKKKGCWPNPLFPPQKAPPQSEPNRLTGCNGTVESHHISSTQILGKQIQDLVPAASSQIREPKKLILEMAIF